MRRKHITNQSSWGVAGSRGCCLDKGKILIAMKLRLIPVVHGSFPFARMQSHQTSVLSLPGSRFAVFGVVYSTEGLGMGGFGWVGVGRLGAGVGGLLKLKSANILKVP